MNQAKKSLVSTAVLVLVAAAAGAYAYFGVFKAEIEETERKEAEAKAFTFDQAQVQKLRLTARGSTTEMERDGAHWRLVSPVTGRADASTIDGILGKLGSLHSKEIVAENQSARADFGLEQPSIEVALTLADGREFVLKVGEENPFDQSMPYVIGGDERIHLADPGLKWPLDKTLLDLRDKALVTHTDEDVRALELVSRDGAGWTVEREGKEWKLTTPVADKADRLAVEGILSRVRGARASGFEDDADDLARFGLHEPARTLVFSLGEERAMKSLALGRVEVDGVKKGYARLGDGPVMQIDLALLEDVTKTANDLRDKTVVSFDREKVRRLEIVPAGSAPLVIHRAKEKKDPDADWETDRYTLEGRPDAKVRGWKLSSALYSLGTLKGLAIAAEEASDLSPFGLDAPAFTYALFDEAGEELARILVGSRSGERYHVMKAGSTRVYEVERTTIEGLPRSADEFLEPASTVAETPAGGTGASDG